MELRQRFRRGSVLKLGNLYGPHQPLPIQQVGAVVQSRLRLPQPMDQAVQGECCQLFPQLEVFGDRCQPVAVQNGIKIETGPTHQERQPPPPPDLLIGREKAALELEEIELVSRINDVDEVMRDVTVLRQVLAGADIHPPVDLAGVCGDDLAVEATGQFHPQAGLARCGGAEYDEQITFHDGRHSTVTYDICQRLSPLSRHAPVISAFEVPAQNSAPAWHPVRRSSRLWSPERHQHRGRRV